MLCADIFSLCIPVLVIPFSQCFFLFVSINEVLNYGLHDVELGCKGVCSHIQQKDIQETCTITCDALGLYAFVKLIQTKDIDPIYYCEGLSPAASRYRGS